MDGMSVEVPDMDELLRLAPVARYGDWEPGESSPSPRGGARHLSAVLPALSAAIGCPISTAVHRDSRALQHALGLPDVRSAIVVLVDGLGFWNVAMRLGHAPTLRSLMRETANQRPMSTCEPSTTVAAMATFGTGTCPGLTGMAGYTQRDPATGRMIQLIQFKEVLPPEGQQGGIRPGRTGSGVTARPQYAAPALDPLDLQREPTVFESLQANGVRVTSCGLAKFADSPLTSAALRGPEYVAKVTPGERVRAAAEAAREPGLTYLYIRDTDKIGHAHGWDSERWIDAFERVDGQLAQLRRLAPRGTLIVVLADHGMVTADPAQRIDIAAEPALARGVAQVGGEPRSLMLYAEEGQDPHDIAGRWRNRLGDSARVTLRDEAIDGGLFGPVSDRIRPMLGDIIVQAAGQITLVDTRTQGDKATRLPAVHGSQTMLESDIPFLVDLI